MYINTTKVNNDNKLTILYINIDAVVYMIFCSQSLQSANVCYSIQLISIFGYNLRFDVHMKALIN